MSKLADLDANFVLDVSYKKSNLSRLLAELDGNGVRYEVRPGSNDTNVYVFIRDNGTGVVKEVSKDEIVKGVIPLYGKEETKRLQFIWRSSKNRLFPRASELVELASITGDPRMALYFAFQKSYTKWLVPLAVLGMAFRLFSTGSPWEFNMAYSIAVLAWGIAFSVMWQYTIEPEYSDMFGYRAILPVSDSKSTIVKKLCFIPIAFTFTVCLVAFQFLCFLMEIYITQIYNGPLSMVLALVPTVLISAYVPVLTTVYNVFVNRLVSWENSMMPERSKSRKLFVFSFLTSYAPLLITLFVYLPLGHLLNPQLNLIAKHSKRYNIPVVNDRFVINSDRYRAQFFYFTVTNQVIALALENALPIIMARLPTALGGPSSNTLESRRSLKMASEKYPQDVELLEKVFGYFTGPWGVFNVDDNVRKLVLQFGYIVIFSTIWPLAPLVCIFFNVIMCKLDMWRATKKNRPTWSKDIVYTTSRDLNPITLSPWDSILNFLVWSASLIAPTIVIMYRKCNLPGVGFNFSKAASGEREKWYLESPIKYDWKLIMIYGMLAEHAGMLFRYLLTKLVSAPASIDSAKSPVALKEKQVTEKGGHVNDAFSFHQGVSSPLRINNNEKESCSSDSMYSSTTRHEKEHNSYISTARDYTHGMLASDNKGVDNAIEGIKNNENTTASGVEDTRTLHSPLMVNRPTGADVITESAPNHYNGSGVPGSSPHAPQGGEVPQGGNQNGHHDNQTPNTRHADARPLPLPHQPVKTSLPGMNSNQGQRVASSNNMAPSTAVSSSVAGATLPETIPTSKNYDERQRNLSSPLQNAYSSTRTVTTPTLDPRRQDAPRPSYTIPQPLPRSPDRGEQFIPTAGIHRLNTDHASHPGVTNVSQTSPTITRSPVDNLRGPVEIIGTPMKIVEGGERTDSRIPIAVDESRIPPGSEAKPHNPSTSGGILTLFPNSALSSPAKDATSATSPNGLIVDAPLPSVNGVTQIPVFAVENASSTDAVPNGSTAPVEVNRMAVETSTHHMNGYRMQPEQAQSRELPSDNRSVGARDASVIQGSSNVPANGPTYDHSATLNNGIKTVNRRKSNSIKSFTKLIGSPSKKDHTPSKNKKLKSPLSILKKKFEQ